MNEQKNFSQYIDIYINEEKTDYSIIINAQWGAGKTHFIKNYCEKKSDIDSEHYDVNNYVYFSLKGISDIKQLINSIYLRILLKFKTEKKNFIGELIENFNLDKFVELFNNKKLSTFYQSISLLSSVALPSYIDNYLMKFDNKIILFLDDLERISEKIDLNDLLGELDTQFIAKGIKIVYITYEEEFSPEHKKQYNKNKEKYIRRTYSYNPDKSETFLDLLKEFSLENELDLFDSLISSFPDNPTNLRTVKYCCTLYKELLKASKEFTSSSNYQSVLILLPSICEYAKFLANNNISKQTILSFCPGEYQFLKNYLAATYAPSQDEKPEEKKTEKEKCIDFFDKYSHDNSITLYTNKFLIDFIFDGYLNKNELEKFLRIEIQEKDPLNTLVYHIYDYDFDDIKDSVYKVYEKIEKKEYSIDELNLLINNFLPLALKILQLDDVTSNKIDIEEQIKKNLFDKDNKEEFQQKIIEKTHEIITERITESIFSKQSEEALFRLFEYKTKDNYYEFPKFTNTFNKKIQDEFNKFIGEKNAQNINELFEAIKTATYSEIFKEIDEHKIFSMLREANKFEEILNLPSKSIQFLIKFINSKILGLGNAYQFYMTEIPTLIELQNLIKQKIDSGNPDFIKIDLLKQLDKTIEDAVKHIVNSKNF